MKMAQKKTTLSKYLPWILIAGAGAAAYYYFRPRPTITDEIVPPPVVPTLPGNTPPTPPNNSTPPLISTPVMIGKPAKIKIGQQSAGFITKAMGSIFTKGGSNGSGGLTSGIAAGTVQEVDQTWQSVRVLNYAYPMKTVVGNVTTPIYSYWLPLAKLEGNY